MKSTTLSGSSSVRSAAWVLAAAFFVAALASGCGGDEKQPKKPDKKGDKGQKAPSDKPKPAPVDNKNMDQIEELKDRIKTEVEPMLTEGASLSEILKVKEMVDEADKKIASLGGDKTTDAGNWNKLRDRIMDMLLAPALEKITKDEAAKKPEDYDGAIQKYNDLIKYFDGVKGGEVAKTISNIKKEIGIIESLRDWSKKTPGEEMDLLAGGMEGWEVWGNEKGNVKVGVSGGEMTITMDEGKEYGSVTAKHAFWKNYIAEIHFTIHSGEFTVAHRDLPRFKNTPFFSSMGGDDWAGKKMELTFKMIDSSLEVLDPEGERMEDPIPGDIPGGGITFKVTKGTKVTIHKVVVKKQ